jgi:uncharacterized protein (TIGR02678 family)
VVVEREFARLLKTPARHRPVGEFARVQSPRDYEMLSWILWYGEKLGRGQFLLTQMAHEIAGHANLLLGSTHIDWKDRGQRYALLRAVEVLVGAGALARYDGEIERWAQSREGDVLYEFSDLALRIHVSLPDEVYRALAEDGGGFPEAEAEAAGGSAPDVSDEERVFRALLLQPALYRFEDPAAFAVLASADRRRRIADDLAEHLGWELEVTPNYAAVVRTSPARQRRTFPRRGTSNQVALLMAGRIRELVEAGELAATDDDRVPVSRVRLESVLRDIREMHGTNWSVSYRNRAFADQFDEAVSTMREWGLVEGPDAEDRFAVLPLAGRFRAVYTNREDALAPGEQDEG